MSAIIAMYGQPTKMIVEGKEQEVIPFVGADRGGDFASMGVGFLSADKKSSSLWGLIMPHALIKSWRGMKLLEHMKRIEHGTLCYCHTACGRNISDSDQESIDTLAEQFKSREAFDRVLKSIMNSVPNIEDTIHNVISSKIIIRKFLKYFRRKYRWRKKYWLYFSIKKDFHLNIKKDFQELLKNNK